MASQPTKMFAVLALLALCASAATAALAPNYFSPIMAANAIDPCMQYCMMQQAFTMSGITSPVAMPMLQQPWLQQCGMQMMMPSMMTTPPQCHCGAIWQMMQQQQLPFMSCAMTPSAVINQPCSGGACFQQPFVGGAFFQQPFLGCAF